MKITRLQFWIRFFLFLAVFTVAFFLLLFVTNKNPGSNLQMLFIKIGILATICSLVYNLLLSSEREMIDSEKGNP